MLKDREDRFWVRHAFMAVVRYRFISPVGEDQEAYYEQKYLLSKPISVDDPIIAQPPASWIQYCASIGMCDFTH